MNHQDHVQLLQEGVTGARPGPWADLGSGQGAFTLALADLLGPGGTIYSVDRDRQALREQREALATRFPDTQVQYLVADFTRPLQMPQLAGVVMANSLHFAPLARQEAVLRLVSGYLGLGGRVVVIEYDLQEGNPWVPYPLTFRDLESLAVRAGFRKARPLARRHSRMPGNIYSALVE